MKASTGFFARIRRSALGNGRLDRAASPVVFRRSGGSGAPRRHSRTLLGLALPLVALAFTAAPASAATPIVTLNPPIVVGNTTAQVKGTFDPNGETGGYSIFIEYHKPGEPCCGGGEVFAESVTEEEVEAANETHTPIVIGGELTGLAQAQEYFVRLDAYNGVENKSDPEVSFTTTSTPEPPTAFASTNTPESASSVILRGAVDQNNRALTDCHFAYGPASGGLDLSAPCEGIPAPGEDPVPVTARLTGLAPGTIGHYKVVATNGGGTGESLVTPFATFAAPEPEPTCANQARREEEHAGTLPECRGYELVSPPDKSGGDVMAESTRTRVAVGGDAVEFSSLQAFGDTKGADVATEYIAARDGTPGTQGWGTHGIYPEVEAESLVGAFHFQQSLYVSEFSPDLSEGVFTTTTPLTADPATADVPNLYLREGLLGAGTASSRLLSSCPLCAAAGPLSAPDGHYKPVFADSTPDLGQVIFEAPRNLTADAAPQPAECSAEFKFSGCLLRLYESDHGTERLVGRIPPPGQSECDDAGADPCEAAPISIAGQGTSTNEYTLNTISDDGSEVFFTVPSGPGERSGDLYMRLNHTKTIELNASVRTDCADHSPCTGAPEPDPAGPQPASYQIASADGSKVFFDTSEQLTNTPDSELYVYDTTLPASDPNHLQHVYPGDVPVRGVFGTSTDGSYLYFDSNKRPILPNQPQSYDANSLYVWHEGAIAFIGSSEIPISPVNSTVPGFGTRVTPDGRTLLFSSQDGGGLTDYDHGSCRSLTGGTLPCRELYRYRADTASLTCVSCNPSGAPATTNADSQVRAQTGGAYPSRHLNHPLTSDGSHVFFESGERLVPEDTNAVSDVYSYDALDGTLHLLSSGNGPDPSHFLDATADGSDVFLSTDQRLLGWDTDQSYDLYDARAGGGFPEPPPVPAPCEGDSCRTAPGAPAATSPASQGFQGPGNPKPKCKKGFAKKHGECVKKSHPKEKNKHKKKGHKHHHGKKSSHKGGGGK